jgi:MinD superfamily P-loop ATPase
MKHLLVLSGKGGTGKTTVASAFISLSRCRAFADCDVDAPNLHLVVQGMKKMQTTDYSALGKAVIDSSKCTGCGLCGAHCRFGAITNGMVDPYECEGCAVCERLCPEQAIRMAVSPAGRLLLYRNRTSVFSTAQLNPGSGTTGKLVAAVKTQLSEHAPEAGFTITDGSPGTGCPVMASLSGADIVLIVTEPTVSGLHDMKRLVELISFLKIPCVVCINKFDVNQKNTEAVESYCRAESLAVIGKIPFDKTVPYAVNRGKSIDMYPHSPAGMAVTDMWQSFYKTYIQG